MDSSAPKANRQFKKQGNGRAVGLDSDPTSVSSNNGRKITRQDIETVQNLIERCLQLYMNKNEVVNTLLEQARIEPGFTSLVWRKLEDENAEFFEAYRVRLTLKEQIDQFNQLLERQYELMNYSSSQHLPSHQNPCTATSLHVGNSILQQSGVPSTLQVASTLGDCQVANGIPASGNFHQLHLNPGKEMMSNGYGTVSSHSLMGSEISANPASVTSNGRFSLPAASNLDSSTPNSSYAATPFLLQELHPGVNGGGMDYCGMPRSLPRIDSWNFSDFASVGENGHMELPDSGEEGHDMVEKFFVDSDPPSSPLSEEKNLDIGSTS